MNEHAPPVVFGDWSRYITVRMDKSKVMTADTIDRLARDRAVHVSLSGNVYYKGALVETICGVPASEVAPLVRQRRREIAEAV